MNEWADFYERLFNFREIRYFDRARPILANDHPLRGVGGGHRTKRAENLDLLIAHCGGVKACRGLHRDQREQLEHVVLDHVAKRACPVIIVAAPFEADRFGDGNLDMIDRGVGPQRLEHHIGEAQREQVLDGLLAQIMVDAERL